MRVTCRSLLGLIFGLVLSLAAISTVQAASNVPEPTDAAVTATPVPLDPEDVSKTSVGELTYAGGLVLRGKDANFGGISGLVVSKDGVHFLAMSDRGTWIAGALAYEKGRLTGVKDVEDAPMLDWRGDTLTFNNNDSEGLAWTGNSVLVSFEHFHRIWRYSLPSMTTPEEVFRQTAIALPSFPGLKEQPANGGLEAITELPDGRLLAVSEEARTKEGNAKAWLVGADHVGELSLPVSGGFAPTDAATLTNGDVLLLERRFSLTSGVAMRLLLISAASIKEGGVMSARQIAEITPPMTVDNMEGLAAIPDGKGYRLFMVSDDNFNVLQRTLLLSFMWTPK